MTDLVKRLRDTAHGIRLSREAADEIERLQAALATARDDALEEAAGVATWYGTDRGFPDGKTGAFRKHRGKIAEQIRAMKAKP